MLCRHKGFTLIEVLVSITLVAVLLGLGLPAMSTLIQNNKIGSAAASYYAGLQLARTEAVKNNFPVEFILTNGTGVAAAPAIGGRNWVVRATGPGAPVLVDQKIGLEGEGGAGQAIQLNLLVVPGGFDGRITFDGFGAPKPKNPYSIEITNPRLGSCAPGGPARCRHINVAPGGQITACDPAAVTVTGDTRAC